jgi:hypothetical protein
MPVSVFLLLLGLPAVVAGGWVALDIRGASAAMERHQARNHALRTAAVGDFTPPTRWITAVGFRVVGGAVCLGGLILALAGLLEL